MEIKELSQHKESKSYIKDRFSFFKLRDKDGGRSIWADNMDLYDTEDFNDRFWNFFNKINVRNGKGIKRGSYNYLYLKSIIIKKYIKVLTKIIVQTALDGDKLLWYQHVMSTHIGEVTAQYKGKPAYRYIHAYKGAYPVMISALSTRVLYSIRTVSKEKELHFIYAFCKRKMNRMISYRVQNGTKYLKDINTILKSESRWKDT